MKFTIARSTFLEGLKTVQNVAPTNNQSQIIQNVLLVAEDNKLKMRTTDLEISVYCELDCNVQEAGQTTLPVRLLFNSVSKAIEGLVEVSVDSDEKAKIVANSAKYSLNGISAKMFPSLPKAQQHSSFVMPLLTLKEMVRKTAYAMSTIDIHNKALLGLYMRFKDQKIIVVAADGRRLAMVEHELEFPAESEAECLLTNKLVQEIKRISNVDGDVTIELQGTQICLSFANTKIYSKLLDDKYPNFYNILPKDMKERIVVDRTQLLDVLERVSVMSVDNQHSVRFIFESDILTVTSTAFDVGSARDELPIKYKGEKIETMFNPSYIMEPLRAIDDDEVVFEMNDGTTPAYIKCSIPFLYLIMPLRIN